MGSSAEIVEHYDGDIPEGDDLIRRESGITAVIKKIKYDAAHNETLKLLLLKEVKEKKLYRSLNLTWVSYCESLGENWRTIDAKLGKFAPLEEFSVNLADFSQIPFKQISMIGTAISAENVKKVGDDEVEVGKQVFKLTPENVVPINTAVKVLAAEHKKQVEDREKDISALRRMNEDKEKQIQKLHKEIEASDAAAKKAGYANVTEAKYIKRIDNLRTRFAGLMLELDPEDRLVVPEDATVNMKAAYIGLLEEMRNKILGFWDTASIHRQQRPGGDPEWNPADEIASAEE